MTDRTYDLVLFGATGFTGRQAAHYLDAHAPEGLRWAIAARSADKLARLKGELSTDVDTVVADGTDAKAMSDLAASTRVACSTAGPFEKYSDLLVGACAEHGTHYCDITGETPWARTVIDRFHERAAATGARIVPFCGFDSIPSDLGAFMMVEHLRQAHDQGTAEVATAFGGKAAGLNGGTLDSALNIAEKGQARQIADPYLLNPPERRPEGRGPRDDLRVFDDPDLGLVGPFFMASINSRVVRRSAALFDLEGQPYGESFHYREHMQHRSKPKAWAVSLGMGAFEGLLKRPLGRKVLRRFGPGPGEGPSEEAMESGTTSAVFAATGEGGARARGTMFVKGDPGNRATVLMLAESALALATQTDELPPRAGVLTPSTAMGDVLLARLRDAGMTWEVADA